MEWQALCQSLSIIFSEVFQIFLEDGELDKRIRILSFKMKT